MKQLLLTMLLCIHFCAQLQAADSADQKIYIEKLLNLITGVVQEFTSEKISKSPTYNAHNCTQSKILLRLRKGVPEDLYTPDGWYRAPWASLGYKLHRIPVEKQHLCEFEYHLILSEQDGDGKSIVILQELVQSGDRKTPCRTRVPSKLRLKNITKRADILQSLKSLIDMKIYKSEDASDIYEILGIKNKGEG